MKAHSFFKILSLLTVLAAPSFAQAQDFGTKPEAQEMAIKAANLVDKSGRDAAFAEFDKTPGDFKQKDMYVFAFGFDGTAVFHGGNKALQGKNLITLKDPDGKTFIADIINVCKNMGEGWVDYKWFDKDIGRVLPKSSYVKKTKDDLCVGVGVYTR
jgi:signal transduction histidine kinase